MKISPEILPKEEIDYINSQSERDRRILAAFAAKRLGWHGVNDILPKFNYTIIPTCQML